VRLSVARRDFFTDCLVLSNYLREYGLVDKHVRVDHLNHSKHFIQLAWVSDAVRHHCYKMFFRVWNSLNDYIARAVITVSRNAITQTQEIFVQVSLASGKTLEISSGK
jgi:hypothetical protein